MAEYRAGNAGLEGTKEHLRTLDAKATAMDLFIVGHAGETR
jgi:hypothetical protein